MHLPDFFPRLPVKYDKTKCNFTRAASKVSPVLKK